MFMKASYLGRENEERNGDYEKDISDTPVGFDGRLHDARDGVCDWGYSW
ncbi:hypothetical protein CE91St49_25980 [Emergencia timonensis]|nr:hypothetical protein CE91St48_26050 [Emergencia timonensis]BDF13251.1 hypothetical protein CE91St49_25980 [Emergencia timonensis]